MHHAPRLIVSCSLPDIPMSLLYIGQHPSFPGVFTSKSALVRHEFAPLPGKGVINLPKVDDWVQRIVHLADLQFLNGKPAHIELRNGRKQLIATFDLGRSYGQGYVCFDVYRRGGNWSLRLLANGFPSVEKAVSEAMRPFPFGLKTAAPVAEQGTACGVTSTAS